jgi:DNA ligase D-like protein (predicted polymerase)
MARQCGHGLPAKAIREISAGLTSSMVEEPPPGQWPAGMAPVKPELMCEVRFAGWTASGKLRAPVFLRIVDEAPRVQGKAFRAVGNPEKLFFPEDGFRKKDIAAYYERIAPLILPYLKDRPISLRRFPDGIHGKSFFQRHPSAQTPSWVPTALVPREDTPKENEDRSLRVFLCQDLRSLLYFVNLGCIDFHAWTSGARTPRRPDYYLVDLDADGCGFEKVVEAAFAVREIVSGTGLESYAKTSGGDGIHLRSNRLPERTSTTGGWSWTKWPSSASCAFRSFSLRSVPCARDRREKFTSTTHKSGTAKPSLRHIRCVHIRASP